MSAFSIRIGDAVYTEPFQAGDAQRVYSPQTWLVSIAYDDGDRFVSVASREVLAAFADACGGAHHHADGTAAHMPPCEPLYPSTTNRRSTR
jgi:hypothetical protein